MSHKNEKIHKRQGISDDASAPLPVLEFRDSSAAGANEVKNRKPITLMFETFMPFVLSFENSLGIGGKMFGSPETSPPNVLVGGPVRFPGFPIEAFGNDGLLCNACR